LHCLGKHNKDYKRTFLSATDYRKQAEVDVMASCIMFVALGRMKGWLIIKINGVERQQNTKSNDNEKK